MILKKNEFMLQVLELSGEDDTEVQVNYKDMTLHFSSGAVYKMTEDGLKDPKAEKVDKKLHDDQVDGKLKTQG